MIFKDIIKSRDYIHSQLNQGGEPSIKEAISRLHNAIKAIAMSGERSISTVASVAICLIMDAMWYATLEIDPVEDATEHINYGSTAIATGDAIYYLSMTIRDMGVNSNWRGRGVEDSLVHAIEIMEYLIIQAGEDPSKEIKIIIQQWKDHYN